MREFYNICKSLAKCPNSISECCHCHKSLKKGYLVCNKCNKIYMEIFSSYGNDFYKIAINCLNYKEFAKEIMLSKLEQ